MYITSMLSLNRRQEGYLSIVDEQKENFPEPVIKWRFITHIGYNLIVRNRVHTMYQIFLHGWIVESAKIIDLTVIFTKIGGNYNQRYWSKDTLITN